MRMLRDLSGADWARRHQTNEARVGALRNPVGAPKPRSAISERTARRWFAWRLGSAMRP
jgi:hypothetical protein